MLSSTSFYDFMLKVSDLYTSLRSFAPSNRSSVSHHPAFLFPDEEKYSHSMMLPSPSFIEGMVSPGCSVVLVLGHTKHVGLENIVPHV